MTILCWLSLLLQHRCCNCCQVVRRYSAVLLRKCYYFTMPAISVHECRLSFSERVHINFMVLKKRFMNFYWWLAKNHCALCSQNSHLCIKTCDPEKAWAWSLGSRETKTPSLISPLCKVLSNLFLWSCALYILEQNGFVTACGIFCFVARAITLSGKLLKRSHV